MSYEIWSNVSWSHSGRRALSFCSRGADSAWSRGISEWRGLLVALVFGLLVVPSVSAEDAAAAAAPEAAPAGQTAEASAPAPAPAPASAPSGKQIFGQAGQSQRVSDPKAAAVVQKYLGAIGGRPVLDSIRDRKVTYVNTLFQAASETEARITLLMKGHYNLREEWNLDYEIREGQKLEFVQIYNGDDEEGWVQVMGRVDKLDGKTLLVFVHGKYLDDFFCHWEEDGYVLSLAGDADVEVDGGVEKTDVVQVVDFSGRQSERYFFSQKTGLILKKEWLDTTRNPKKPMPREQFYKRYRNIPFMDDSGKSVKIPMLLEIYGDGDLDTERRFESVAFNLGLEDQLFDRPEGAPGPKVTSSGKGGKPILVDPLKDAEKAAEDAEKAAEDAAKAAPPAPGHAGVHSRPGPGGPTPAPAPAPSPSGEGETKTDAPEAAPPVPEK